MGYNPKSKENLVPITSSEQARRMQAKGVETRRARRALREQFMMDSKELEEMGAINIMRGLMQHHLDCQDYDKAAELATKIAEYETPKLTRAEVNQTTSVKDLTDEELAEELAKLKSDK